MNKVLVYGMTDNKGGIESYLMNMYRHIDKSLVNFDFIVDFPTMAYAEEVLQSGSVIHYIPAKGKHPIAHLNAFRKVLRLHPEYKYVYFNILNAGAAYTMAGALFMGRRIITHSHNGADDNMKLHRFFKPLLRLFSAKFLACSEVAARFMYGDKLADSGKVTLINNAIEISNFTFDDDLRLKKRQELNIADNFVVLHVGRMAPQKNSKMLIDIFSELYRMDKSSVLLYAGTGPLEAEIKEYARFKELDGALQFLGMRNDIKELLQAADVFLLPSLYEGLPVVLVEAQAADLNCFTSKGSVSSESKITDRLTFLPLSDSAHEWANTILSYRNDTNLRRDVSNTLIKAGYDIKHEAKRLENVFRDL